MSEPLVLDAQMTRAGLRKLFELDGGLSEIVTHIGLTSTAFEANAELTEIPNEIQRWPVLDGYPIDSEEVQFDLWAMFPWTGGNDKVVRGFGFYLSDGTLIASYSSNQIEAYLSSRFVFDSIIHVVLPGAPSGSVTVVNTGKAFNPGVLEFMLESVTNSTRALRNYLHTLSELDAVNTANDQQARNIDALNGQVATLQQTTQTQSTAIAELRNQQLEQQMLNLTSLTQMGRAILQNTLATQEAPA